MCEKGENNIGKPKHLVLKENSRMKRNHDQISKSDEISYKDETEPKKKVDLENNNNNTSIVLNKGSDKTFNTKNIKKNFQILPNKIMSRRNFTVINASNIIQFYNNQQCANTLNESFKSNDAVTKSNILSTKVSNIKNNSDVVLSKINEKDNCVLESSKKKQERSKTSTDQHLKKLNPKIEMNSISCQTIRCPLLSIEIIKDDDRAVEFYTGLQSYHKFIYAFQLLGKDAYDLNYYYPSHEISLSILDQFFMTLVMLKLHKSHYEISILFQVSLKDIKNIFITWVRFMQLEWCNLRIPKFYQLKLSSVKYNFEDKPSLTDNSTIAVHNNNKDIPVINLATEKPINNFKKVYKILNGPDNYIEKHLRKDIVFVCYMLCYFRMKKVSTLHPIKIEK